MYLLSLSLLLLVSPPVASKSTFLRRVTKSPTRGPPTPPLPTFAQERWQRDEIMALTHFNMGTFFHNGDPCCDASNWNGCDAKGGCRSSDPASFNPTNLNVSNWVASYQALGVSSVVLTGKHGCGFYLWPTQVKLPNGTTYPYAVNSSLNVVKLFSDTLSQASPPLRHGFYYSLSNSFFMNELGFAVRPPSTLIPGQVEVTQQEFEDIAVASITELWTNFGKDLGEIWFDGGYQSELGAKISALLASLQPNALALNGEGISPSPGRWSGTEGNIPPGWPNIYSTTCCDIHGEDPAHMCEGSGCPPDEPNAIYAPSSTDFTLQSGDVWFWEPNTPLRPLTEMVATYHSTIGANTVLELDFAIDRTGNVDPTHAALYQAFGDWRRACYGGAPLATGALEGGGATSITLTLNPTVAMDRVVLQEALAQGQCVSNYTLEVLPEGQEWQAFGRTGAHLIGNKRIELNGGGPGETGPPINATALRFNVTGTFFNGSCTPAVNVSVFSPELCIPQPPPRPPPRSRVRFMYPDGRCLATNASASFPCYSTSCPLFLGDCSLAEAVWDDGGAPPTIPSPLVNLGVAQSTPTNVVNVDCDYCTPGSPVKLEVGSPAMVLFTGGKLTYACPGGGGGGGGGSPLCFSGGLERPPNRPCNPSEPFLTQQVQVDLCSNPGTDWARVVVE